MFYLKNDDMEELFRKAAENYEVDTGKASNWEAINDALHNNSDNNPEDKNKKKKRRFIFWWFLLFPAGWMAHNTWTKMGNRDTTTYKHYAAPVQYQPVDKTQSSAIQPSANEQSAVREKGIEQQLAINEEEAIGQSNGDVDNTVKDNNAVAIEKTIKQKSVATNKNNNTKEVNEAGAIKSIVINNNKNTTGNSINIPQKGKSTLTQNNLTGKALFEKNKRNRSNLSEKNNVYPQDNMMQNDNASINAAQQWVNKDLMWALPPVENSVLNLQKTIPDSQTFLISNDSTAKQKNVRLQKEKIHYFYLDAVVSPDLTTVKLQHISGAGSSFGLLLGYRLNKRWHVEAGAFMEKKVYYTKGQYFDTSKLSDYLRSVEILDVDGNCKMITVPVNVRYNVLTNARRNWFVATGVSSYFMTSEYYDYNVKHPGGQPYVTSKGYKVSENDWLSVVNISLGYERTFWKSYHLRVEPYFRLPLSGVGTGNLSLSSTGIYIGIGRRF